MSIGAMLGLGDVPVAGISRQYIKVDLLVDAKEEQELSTHMRNLHTWYMRKTQNKAAKDWFAADVRPEHHYKPYFTMVDISELF